MGLIIFMTHLHIYLPKTVDALRRWIEEVKHNYAVHNYAYLIVNEDGKAMDLNEYLQPFSGKDLREFKNVDVLFVYPECGKTLDEIRKFVDFVIDLANHYAHIDIYTVSEWVLTFVNLYMYVGEMTTEERKIVAERFKINKHIRHEDVRVEWLSYNAEKNEFEFERVNTHGSPPEFDFVYEDQACELSSLFVGLQLIYDDFRTE
jgi:hypothetical protein